MPQREIGRPIVRVDERLAPRVDLAMALLVQFVWEREQLLVVKAEAVGLDERLENGDDLIAQLERWWGISSAAS